MLSIPISPFWVLLMVFVNCDQTDTCSKMLDTEEFTSLLLVSTTNSTQIQLRCGSSRSESQRSFDRPRALKLDHVSGKQRGLVLASPTLALCVAFHDRVPFCFSSWGRVLPRDLAVPHRGCRWHTRCLQNDADLLQERRT